jgi:UDP-N-acetylglucosamine--N-acetylmuramyl-(pentapeptide) pyrophosphoryl-undecaprenol N-acetylglucosamine transferase
VCVGFDDTAAHFRGKAVVTGNPARPNLAGGSRSACLRRFGLPADRPVIAVIGGSQGAATLNELVVAAVPALVPACSVIHLTGRGKQRSELSRSGYVQREFVHDEIRDIYAASDLIVSRAGAGAIEEICAYQIPALYVPYPWAEADHQAVNARVMADAGVAEVLVQRTLTSTGLLDAIGRMLVRRESYAARFDDLVRPPALDRLTDVLLREASG